jgi:putative ABC transport system permease protein
MNLALRDIRHKSGRFVLTCLGLSLLLAVVITMAGIFRGLTADAFALVEAVKADIWVVEAGTRGPFAESSRIPGDTREMVARIAGVAAAGSVTLQSIQIERNGRKLRLQVVGYEPGRPGGPVRLIAGREITRSHYELIADRQTGLTVGETLPLGRRGHDYAVVGATSGIVTFSGDSILYMSLKDAQELQFEQAPPAARREAARSPQRAPTDLVNAVVARLAPDYPPDEVAESIRRWKHLSVLTDEEQKQMLTQTIIERTASDRSVHERAHGGVRGHHRPHHLHAHHGKDPRDRDAEADRRARPHHHRPHPATGPADGGHRVHHRHLAGLCLQRPVPPSRRHASR